MILHCTKKLAAKLPQVSTAPLEEMSPLGGWHGHLYHIDHRQCVMFCHDRSRFVLFLPGLRKEHFANLGNKWFRPRYLATLQSIHCHEAHIRKVELGLGPIRYDTATDRSVQSAMRVARQDLDAWIMRASNVMELDPVLVSREMCHRPTWIYGKSLWPDKAMLEAVAAI